MLPFSLLFSELRASRFRLVPAARIASMQFVVDGTTASARLATDRANHRGRVLEILRKDLENHRGSGPKRIGETARLIAAIDNAMIWPSR